jgi:hypothetical protein
MVFSALLRGFHVARVILNSVPAPAALPTRHAVNVDQPFLGSQELRLRNRNVVHERLCTIDVPRACEDLTQDVAPP